MDVESVRRWWDYTKAYQVMLEAIDTPSAPWHVVPADDKRRARLNLISHMLREIPYEMVRVDLPKTPRAADVLPENRVMRQESSPRKEDLR